MAVKEQKKGNREAKKQKSPISRRALLPRINDRKAGAARRQSNQLRRPDRRFIKFVGNAT